jgi:uncharacterized membrane protein
LFIVEPQFLLPLPYSSRNIKRGKEEWSVTKESNTGIVSSARKIAKHFLINVEILKISFITVHI